MRRTGAWNEEQVAAFLSESIVPLRLACHGPSGWPAVVSLWFLPAEDGRLWCATQQQSRVVRHLSLDPRCGFEVAPNEPPYCGVRGQARVRIDPAAGRTTLERLIERYLGREETPFIRWLLSRADEEVALILEPVRLSSWDYRRRMQP